MQAPDKPRRPTRRRQRTRGSRRDSSRTTCQVWSGELSSTNTTSHGVAPKVAFSRWYSVVTLSRSLKVGTTTEISGRAACGAISGPGLMASFMRHSYSGRPPCCQEAVPRDLAVKASKTGENRLPGSYWNSVSRISQSLHINAAQRTIRNRDSSVKGAECRLDSNHGGVRND